MKTIRDFLRKHALLLLAALVVLSVPAGVALGKYAKDVEVTDKLNLTVNVTTEEYWLRDTVWDTIYSILKVDPPHKIVLAYAPAEGATRMTYSNGTVLDLHDTNKKESGPIYAYYDNVKKIVYIAPEKYGKMYAASCQHMFLSPAGSEEKFPQQSALTSIVLDNLDTSHTTKMDDMFSWNRKLTDISFGECFDTSKVMDMNRMFLMCPSLRALDLSFFNTSSVTNMEHMFDCCTGLQSLNLSSFNTEKVTNMTQMFNSCGNLSNIDLSSFNFSSVTNLRYLFSNCSALTTIQFPARVEPANGCDMAGMFVGCTSLTTLDLSMFYTNKVTGMLAMFSSCTNLTTIYASDGFVIQADCKIENMFGSDAKTKCVKLVGGNGTKCADGGNPLDGTYARIDRPSQPGYFTDINATQSLTYSVTGTDAAANGFSITSDLAS